MVLAISGNAQEIPLTYVGDVDHLAFRTVERRENDRLSLMLREGLSPNLRASDGTTLLMYAALHGDAGGVSILLDAGADPNAANNEGVTSLIWGAGDLEKTRFLVDAGADVNEVSNRQVSPLYAAAARVNSVECIKYLLNHGANLNAPNNGPALLESAASTGDQESFDFLLEHLKNIDQGDRSDKIKSRIFKRSALWGQRGMIQSMLNHAQKGKLTLATDFMNDALIQALRASDTQLVSVLTQQGAQVPDLISATYADRGISLEFIENLINPETDLQAKDRRGFTALDHAQLRGNKEVERFLTALGAKSGGKIKSVKIPANQIDWNNIDQESLITSAVDKSLDLMLRSSDRFLQSIENCSSCHHQHLPAVAASIAISRGLKVDQKSLDRMAQRIFQKRKNSLNEYYQSPGIINAPHSLGYRLWMWSALGLPPNPVTKGMVWLTASTQQEDGHWRTQNTRTPLEEGDHHATALSIRSLAMFPLSGRKNEFNDRIALGAKWLLDQPAETHTDETFRILGLAWAGVDSQTLEKERTILMTNQNPDGGWAQLKGMDSDAWATGLALMALHATGLDTTAPSYQKGIRFLLNTQFEHGAWYVQSRSRAVLPHFDSHFPFGYDQWISASGTAVATAALALALEPQGSPIVPRIDLESPVSEEIKHVYAFGGERSVNFENDIRPILIESCIDCHDAEMKKGEFSMADRESFINGGVGGTSVIQGKGSESQLIRHVTDQIEDMEMPPLDKRKNYPRLTSEQVKKLTTWIDEGAEWPEGVTLE